jgi:GH24 family phage-related lysozyme (muramidase)
MITTTSWAGIRFVCHWEAFSAVPYWDVTRWSKGFGTIAKEGDPPITVEAAIRLVREHVRKNDEWLAARVKVSLLQHEWDAISSLIYNKWGAASAVLFKLNGGDPYWVNEFANWDLNSKGERKPGLALRRGDEQYIARRANYGDISQYKVFEGVPLTLKEMRPFPAEEPTE